MTTTALEREVWAAPPAASTTLIATNLGWLRQALALLDQLDDRTFADSPASLAPHRVGGHLRHILEFYECFLDGIAAGIQPKGGFCPDAAGRINYDARRRDETVERERAAAAERIRSIIRRLETVALLGDFEVLVRMEDAEPGAVTDPLLRSSVVRELQVLSSHTIHHFALIAVTLRLHGVEVDPTFGVAPSTLRRQARRHEAA